MEALNWKEAILNVVYITSDKISYLSLMYQLNYLWIYCFLS